MTYCTLGHVMSKPSASTSRRHQPLSCMKPRESRGLTSLP